MANQVDVLTLDAATSAVASALLLPAHLTAAQALPRLQASEAEHLVVRRVEGLVVYWYTFSMEWALERVRDASTARPDATLKVVLDLHEFTSAEVRDTGASRLSQPLARDAVVLDGDRFVGVQRAFGAGHLEHPPTYHRPMPPSPPASAGAEPPEFTTLSHALPEAALEAAPEAAAAAASAAPEAAAEPFIAHPRLEAPACVEPSELFTVTVGLSEVAQPGVIGGPVFIDLPAGVQAFELGVQLIVDGFVAPRGLQASLQVDRAHPGAQSVQFELVAPALGQDEPSRLSSLRVLYFFEGQVCGMAQRRIAVMAPQHEPPGPAVGQGQVWTSVEPTAAAVMVQPGLPSVDLTIVIAKPDCDPSQGRCVWTFSSPHTRDLPALPLVTDLGAGTAELGGKLIAQVQKASQLDMVELGIKGLGRTIRGAAPPELWGVLRKVHDAVAASGPARPLNVLLLTAETDIPWELALLQDSEKLIADAPPLLCCQVNLGRWPMTHDSLPPRGEIVVQHMAAVVGDYAARSGWRKLEQAEQEGQELTQRYQAIRLEANAQQVKKLLYGELGDGATGHGAEAVHFACHGEAVQSHALDAAVILENGAALPPEWLSEANLGKQSAPFLFMNACQVGRAFKLANQYSGFPGEAVKGGFRGFLGPLWSVEDHLACDIALNFYDQVFGDGTRAPRPVAEVLREMRARFSDTEPNSLTRLAYVFYGHPGLKLRRTPSLTPTATHPTPSPQEAQP